MTKAQAVLALLRGKQVFYVNIETPNDHDSIGGVQIKSREYNHPLSSAGGG
jgi:hypothetical protein